MDKQTLDWFLVKKIRIMNGIKMVKKAIYRPEILTLEEENVIYSLKIGNNIYIGRAADSLKARVLNHVGALLRGDHHNEKLQMLFDNDPVALELEILEKSIPEKNLTILERKYIEYYRKIGFNVICHENQWKSV